MSRQNDLQAKIRSSIVERRKALGLSQEDVAKLLNISRLTYHRIETGQRVIKFNEIKKISDILGLDLSSALGPQLAKVYRNIEGIR